MSSHRGIQFPGLVCRPMPHYPTRRVEYADERASSLCQMEDPLSSIDLHRQSPTSPSTEQAANQDWGFVDPSR